MPSDSEGVMLLNEKTIPMTTAIIIIACCILIPLALLGVPFIYSKRTKKRKAWEKEREKIKDE